MRHIQGALSLLALASLLHGQTLPYNPTQLSLPVNSSTVYMFRPSSQSPNQAQLLTLDVSVTLPSTSLPWKTVSETLPFLSEDEALPYTPTMEADGSIIVVTGNCSEGAGGLQLWSYASSADKWTQVKTAVDSTGQDVSAEFLAASIAFSELVDSSIANTKVYAFGGMCPTAATTIETWQSSAQYSNSMLTLSPGASGNDAEPQYQISALENRGPPIPQAGVSITPLSPTYSLSSSGSPQTQEQDFVLLGGHTQAAFINTSQVAVFSLPQQSWSFMPVQQPDTAKSDLVKRQSVEVTPRSGHSAILSADGDSIVLFGGWVGDINTPATPQLAILNLGDGYGGSGDWTWTLPQATGDSGSGLPGGTGIYGHGAVMLPGGVMMVVGGYEIPAPTARRFKRSLPTPNTAHLFYNVTSNKWLESYNVPTGYHFHPQQQSGPLSHTGQKVGLGTGLGIGAALLVSVVVFYFWYRRRVNHLREDRDRNLLMHSSDGSSFGQIDQPYMEMDRRGDDDLLLGRSWPSHNPIYPGPPPMQMQHTTGVFVDVPSPTRGLRRGVAAKNYQYQPAPRFDDKRMSQKVGSIHPIAEQENEDDVVSIKSDREQLDDAEAKLKEIERVLTSNDPFADPTPNPLGSHPMSSEQGDAPRHSFAGPNRVPIPARSPLRGALKSPNWTVEPGTEEDEGRISPIKSNDPTSPTLGDWSQRSLVPNTSIRSTMSTRTGAMLAAAMAAQRRSLVLDSPDAYERTETMSSDASYFHNRSQSFTSGSVITTGAFDGGNHDTFRTARTDFTLLQSEGEALLGGRPTTDPDDPYQRAPAAQGSSSASAQVASYTRGAPAMASRRRPGWMGSLRKVLNVAERSFSLTGSSVEQYKDDPRSASSSPTKERGSMIGQPPRRAISDGGALLRQKRGQKDWDEKDWAPYRDDPEDWGEPTVPVDKRQTEEDWDVEEAANKRDFQVMFTVPKTRLRVINEDLDRASLRSVSEGGVSRSGSLKDLHRQESMKMLTAMREGGQHLPLTEEKDERETEKEKAA